MDEAKMQPKGWTCCSGPSNGSIGVLPDQDLSHFGGCNSL